MKRRTPPTLLRILTLLCVLTIIGCDSGPQLFYDLAEDQELQFVSYTGDHVWYLIDTLGAGLAAGDINGDRRPDLLLLTGSAVTDEFAEEASKHRDALWENTPKGFTDVTERAGVGSKGWSNGAVFADYDGDADIDIFVARHGPNLLWRNNGDGTFSEVAREAGVADPQWGAAAAFADLDGDGDLDLYVTNYARFSIDEQKGTVTWFTLKQFPHYFEPTDNLLYENNGDGTFTDITTDAGVGGTGRSMTVLATDYDDDVDLDLFVANDIGFNDLYRNDGEMRFTNVALESGVACDAEGRFQASMGAAAADYDNDGDIDIMVTNYGNEYHTLYRNEGDGLFTDVSYTAGLVTQGTLDTVGWGVGLYDFDLDGHLDILSVNGHVVTDMVLTYLSWSGAGELDDYSQMQPAAFNMGRDQMKHFFLGRDDRTFEDFSTRSGRAISSPRMSRGAAFADFDGDGRMDVAVSNKNQPLQILLNRIPRGGNWVMLELRGKAPNLFAVGARAQVKTTYQTLTRELLAGTSYCSADDYLLHFGLGDARKVDQVVVRWPNGTTTTFEDLEVNRIHRLEQGSDSPRAPETTAMPR